MNGTTKTEQQKIDERIKFINAFNSTMIRIWRERINLLGVIDTGSLYRAIIDYEHSFNQDATEIRLIQEFKTYGIFQNFGTGKETPVGNPGDIGRAKVRQPRRWFDKKYFSSVMNLRDFFTDSMSQQYLAMMSNALSDRTIRESARL